MVFQFDSVPHSPGRQVSPYLAFFADSEPAGLLFESIAEYTIWPKKKKFFFRSVEFGCFILAQILLCHIVLHLSGIYSSVALSANSLCSSRFYEQMGDSLSSG